jgi:heme-degrading monooxygenase HmoA
MHARVTYVTIRPGKLPEVQRIYRETVVPAAEMQDGFMGAMILADDSKTSGMSITLWDSHDSASAAEANGYFQSQIAKFSDLLATEPDRQLYEVAFNHTAAAVERSHC